MKYFLVIIIYISFAAKAQNQNQQKPCSSPEASQFDFWVGDWILTWNDTLHGSNRIEKMFGNCTVHENFSDPRMGYLGQSWSVYNINYKKWEQTWVDNQGGYIALTGGMAGDSMILTTAERTVPVKISPTGKLVSRMVFYNINSNSFDWSWESSSDGGVTWKPNWLIHYKRKP
ncbi:MAG TPA: hypothetical protein VMY77_01920 [Chitinophagaceae bacterium]|nr:hypothetical protein [Chitinophagaceae bacterium]